MGSHRKRGMKCGREELVHSRVRIALKGALHDVRRNHVNVRMSNMHNKCTFLNHSPQNYPHHHSPSRHPRPQ